VLGAGEAVTTLHFGSSSFSSHQYPELDEAALEAIQTQIQNEKATLNSQILSSSNETEEQNKDVTSSSIVSTQEKENSSTVDPLQTKPETNTEAESMTVVEITPDGSISTRTCVDIDESCSGRATHGDCDKYPK